MSAPADHLDLAVCPSCGAPAAAAEGPHCRSCGLDLSVQERLPTRREWEAGHRADPSQPRFEARGEDRSMHGRPLAGFGYRAAGWIIDASVVAALAYGLGTVVSVLGVGDDAARNIAVVAIFVLWIADVVLLPARTGGRSVGKLVAGLRIVRDDGRRVGLGTGLQRDVLGRIMYMIPFGFLADSLTAVGDQRQTLRDKLVGTHVVREPARAWQVVAAAVAAMVIASSLAVAFSEATGGSDLYAEAHEPGPPPRPAATAS